MENVMTNGFCELNEQEMMMVDGGFDESDWERIDSFLEGMTGYDSKELCNSIFRCVMTRCLTDGSCLAPWGPAHWVIWGTAFYSRFSSGNNRKRHFCRNRRKTVPFLPKLHTMKIHKKGLTFLGNCDSIYLYEYWLLVFRIGRNL